MVGEYIISKRNRYWFSCQWEGIWLAIFLLPAFLIPCYFSSPSERVIFLVVMLICYILPTIVMGKYYFLRKKYNLGRYWFDSNAVFNQFGPQQRMIRHCDEFYLSAMTMRHVRVRVIDAEATYVVLWKATDQVPKNRTRAETAMKKSNAIFLPDQDDVRNALRDYLGVTTIPQYPDIQLCSEQKKLDQMLYDVDGNFLYEQYSD